MISEFIKLRSIDDIKKFINEVTKCAYDVDVSSGRYLIDGKSIMGIFSLDLSKPVKVILRSNDDAECAPFVNFLKDNGFIAEA
jgi:hypothetical protein